MQTNFIERQLTPAAFTRLGTPVYPLNNVPVDLLKGLGRSYIPTRGSIYKYVVEAYGHIPIPFCVFIKDRKRRVTRLYKIDSELFPIELSALDLCNRKKK